MLRGDHNVEGAGVAHQQRRHGVDDPLSYATAGKREGVTARTDSRKQSVDTRSTLALCTAVKLLRRRIASGKTRDLGDPRGPGPRDLADESARSGVGMNSPTPEHRTVGVEAFRILAHDHQINRRSATPAESRRGFAPDGYCEQIEPLAQLSGTDEAALGEPG